VKDRGDRYQPPVSKSSTTSLVFASGNDGMISLQISELLAEQLEN